MKIKFNAKQKLAWTRTMHLRTKKCNVVCCNRVAQLSDTHLSDVSEFDKVIVIDHAVLSDIHPSRSELVSSKKMFAILLLAIGLL